MLPLAEIPNEQAVAALQQMAVMLEGENGSRYGTHTQFWGDAYLVFADPVRGWRVFGARGKRRISQRPPRCYPHPLN